MEDELEVKLELEDWFDEEIAELEERLDEESAELDETLLLLLEIAEEERLEEL